MNCNDKSWCEKMTLKVASRSTDGFAKGYNLADGRKYVSILRLFSSGSYAYFPAEAGSIEIDLCDLTGLSNEFRALIDSYSFVNRHSSEIHVSFGSNKTYQIHQLWIESNILKARIAHSAGNAYGNIIGFRINFYNA